MNTALNDVIQPLNFKQIFGKDCRTYGKVQTNNRAGRSRGPSWGLRCNNRWRGGIKAEGRFCYNLLRIQ